MPRGDRTGPWGAGPMTGRGAGYCAGYDRPGYANQMMGWGMGQGGGYGRGYGRGFGMGYGRGYGYRHAWAPTWGAPPVSPTGSWGPAPSKEQELAALRDQADQLSQMLQAINQRMDALSTKDES